MTPLTESQLRENLRWGRLDEPPEPEGVDRNVAIEVIAFKCPICDTLYEDEDEVEDCCEPEGTVSASGEVIRCPVCLEEHSEFEGAVDCCLWRDLSVGPRLALAAKMRFGANWADAIAEVTGEQV